MTSISLHSPTSNPRHADAVSPTTKRFHAVTFSSTSAFFGSKLARKNPVSLSTPKTPPHRIQPLMVTASSAHTYDVVIVGAGIIGLAIARQFLTGSDLSVAVVDKAVPCSGATGAGQGYIWMAHNTPGSDTWDLKMRSQELWEMFAESVRDQGLNPLEELGWKKTGSLLVGRTPEEASILKNRVKQHSEAGIRAEYLSSRDLYLEEPEVVVGEDGGAAFFPDDCQLDAHRTVAFIEKANRRFASIGRYREFYHEPVIGLLRAGDRGEVEAVLTSKNTLYSKKAIIIASGSWSGSLISDLFRGSDIALDVPVMPRKGHLLVLTDFSFLKLNHGLMETGYVDHQNKIIEGKNSAAGLVNQGDSLSVSMTATMDANGNLVLGSSRQFAGFCTEIDESVINHIWKRAGEFFPKLKELSIGDFTSGRKVRIGLRPYMPDGKPVIGPVPSLSNVFLATGHEGGGLSMSLGTAEMVADMVLGNPGTVSHAPFAVQGRCC